MNTQWSDKDIESLLASRELAASELARLAPFIEALRREAVEPTAERAAVVARTLAEAARDSVGTAPVRRTKVSASWKRRFVVVGGITALATVGIGGLAAAAENSIPGDFLYPVDRAFEAIGIGDGGTAERLEEAVKLAEEGKLDQALEHAADAIEAEGDEDSAGALVTAAEVVSSQGSEQSLEVRTRVSEMLVWMESTDAIGKDFGQGVSERAQSVKDTATQGNSDDAPGQNKDDNAPTDDPKTDKAKTDNSSSGHSSDNSGRGNGPKG